MPLPNLFPIDTPNHRSSHTNPTPRGGGVIFVGLWGILLLAAFYFNTGYSTQTSLKLLIPTLIASLIGLLSDFYTLKSLWRFAGQMLAGIIFLVFLHENALFHFIYLILALFWILWSTNLFNFMDGTDGFASIEGIFVLGVGGGIFYFNQQSGFALIALLMVLLLAIFLIWNWPQAKIFMGDTGSYALGFLIAILALISHKQGHSIFLWLILYSVFCFDATVTLIRRLMHREPIFSAHKKHAYQRLHQAGWSHKKILIHLIALNSLLSLLTFLCFKIPALTPWLFASVLCLLAGIYYRIECLCPFK